MSDLTKMSVDDLEAWTRVRYDKDAELDRMGAAFEELARRLAALTKAAEKVIEMNRQHAEDQYGDADKAESWSCVTVLREALAAQHPNGD